MGPNCKKNIQKIKQKIDESWSPPGVGWNGVGLVTAPEGSGGISMKKAIIAWEGLQIWKTLFSTPPGGLKILL